MFYTKPWLDALIVLLVVLLFVGPKRLPSMGRSLGEGFREFKDGITGAHKDDENQEHAALGAAQPNQMATAAQAQPVGAPASPAQAPPSAPPAAQPSATPAAPAQPPSPPAPESAEVASSEQRS